MNDPKKQKDDPDNEPVKDDWREGWEDRENPSKDREES
jgi:hypothetical protein